MSIGRTIRTAIKNNVNLKAVGNSNRTMRELAIDLVNACDGTHKEIAAGCYLAPSTIKNLATEKTLYPRYDTIERVFRYCEMELNLKQGTLQSEFDNQPKAKL